MGLREKASYDGRRKRKGFLVPQVDHCGRGNKKNGGDVLLKGGELLPCRGGQIGIAWH